MSGKTRKSTRNSPEVSLSSTETYIAISDEHRQALEHYRRQAALSVKDLVRELRGQLTARTLQNVRKQPGHRVRPETLESIARALHVDLEDILLWPKKAPRATRYPDLEGISTFRACADVLKRVDEHVIKFMRSRSAGIPSDVMCRGYAGILDQELRACGLPTAELLLPRLVELIRSPSFLDSVPLTDLVIDVHEFFEEIRFSWTQDHSLRLQSPKLLWDCSCNTDHRLHRISNCPIHSTPEGREVAKRFRNGLILIRWRELEFYWRNEKALWPPSIDSFHMMNNLLLDREFAGQDACDVLDIGSGTGFLGIAAARFLPSIERVVLHDWLLSPVLYGLVNSVRNARSATSYCDILPRLGIHTSSVGTSSSSDPFGMLLCNPPYLPVLSQHERMAGESAVAGTDLLEHVIVNCRTLGRSVYLQFSDIARLEAQRAAERAGVQLVQVGESATVPFRVKIAYEDKGYVEDLLKERGGVLMVRNDRYPHWHIVRTYRIDPD